VRKVTAKMIVAVMLSTSLVASYPYSAHAVQSASPVVNTHLSKPLSIEGKGTIELKTIFSVPNQEGQVVTFSFDIVNQSQEILDFSNYWIRLKSKTGSRYPIKIVDDPSKSRIFPGQKQTLVFYATLPKNVNLADLQPRFIKWDTTTVNFERELGIFPINGNIIPTLGRSVSKFIGLTNNQLEARVAQGEIKREEEDDGSHTTINYTLKLLNKGQQSITLPEYQYILVTDTGVSYPLNVVSTENEQGEQNQILPWIEKQIELQGVVPNTVDLSKVTLYILYPQGDDKGKTMIPVTLFKVFEKPIEEPDTPAQVVDLGTKVELKVYGEKKSEELTANLVLEKIQRFPWDHRDIISAKVKLANTSSKKMAIPQLEGAIQLDQSFEEGAELILSNPEKKELNPGETISYQLIGYIPYSSTFREGTITIKEKAESNDYKKRIKTKIPGYAFTETATRIDRLPQNMNYLIGDTGSQNSLRLADATTYPSANGNLIVARMNVNNMEQRGREVPELKGYFRTSAGAIYPATIGEHSPNNFPNGSSVISFWAELPKEVKQEEVTLIVGEEIKEKGIKDGAGFPLPEDTVKVADKIDTINFYPYTLTFSNFYAEDKGNIQFYVDFKKSKNLNINANLKERKLLFVFTDPLGVDLKTEEVILEGANAWADGTKTISFAPVSDEFGRYAFTLTVYDEFNGVRKALAKQTFGVYRFNNNN